jgi:riboflavin synthase alpha subunit
MKANQLKNGDTIALDGDHLVVFHFSEERGQVILDVVSEVSARRFELHYAPDARISVLS